MRAVVGHDRDRERVVPRQERDREEVLQLAPEHVERELRAGHVGDEQVEQPRGEVQPRGLREHRRRREVLHAGEHLGADRLLGLLEPVHRLRARPAGARPGPRRRPAAARAWPRAGCRGCRAASWARIETGTSARSSSPSVRTPRERSQFRSAAGDDGQHDVVDRAAERVLDELEVVELARARTRSRRCGPISTLSGVSGAGLSAAHATSPTPSSASRARSERRRPGGAAAAAARPASSNGVRTSPRIPRAARSSALGSALRAPRLALVRELAAAPARRRTARSRGRRRRCRRRARGGSWRSARSGCPRAPGRATSPTAAWRGRAAGSGCAPRARAAAPPSPACGSAVWRTWYSRLKLGSSIHIGRPVSIGGNASFCR